MCSRKRARDERQDEQAVPMKVGTDCSGIDCPLMALQSLQMPHIHVFSSELDATTRQQLLANHSPRTMFEDALARDPASTGFTHLYVAGFACQPFSMAGQRAGFRDRRSNVFWACLDYIRHQEPWCWLLENVEGLLSHDGGKTLRTILRTLEQMNSGRYLVTWRVFNSEDHGTPQHRKRVYFLGMRRDRLVQGCEFTWPEPIPRRGLEEFLDPRDPAAEPEALPYGPAMALALWQHRIKRALGDLDQEIVLDVDSSLERCHYMVDRCPCLIRSRPQGYWLLQRQRRMRVREMLRLQGMAHHANTLRQVVPDAALAAMIGNSMSQNVIELLLVRLLPAVGLAAPGQLVDRLEQENAERP